jgi:hypothetical protein
MRWASRALPREPESATRIMLERMAMITMTVMSSIKVNPRDLESFFMR